MKLYTLASQGRNKVTIYILVPAETLLRSLLDAYRMTFPLQIERLGRPDLTAEDKQPSREHLFSWLKDRVDIVEVQAYQIEELQKTFLMDHETLFL